MRLKRGRVDSKCHVSAGCAAPAQSKQVSKETHFRGKRDLLYADF